MEAVLAYYEAGRPVAPPQSGGGTANANLKIETDSGVYFLKRRNPKYARESFVAFDHALMEHLAPCQVGTPRPAPTRHDKTWFLRGEDVYELFPYQPGGPHDRYSLSQISSAGRSLAAYHRAVRDFTPLPGKDWLRYDDPRLTREGIEAIEEDLKQALSPDDFVYLMDRVDLLERDLPDERYHSLPRLVVHGDYHPGNIKYVGDEVSGIFDLDWATVQPRIRDLADGLFLFAGDRTSDIDAADIFSLTQTWQPSLERNRVFMEAYLAAESLSTKEVEALPLFIRARWLYCRVSGMVKVLPERRIEYFTAGLLEPLRAIDEMARLF